MQRKIKIPTIENYSRAGKSKIPSASDAGTKTGVLHLYDGIGPYSGVSAQDFARSLKSLGDVDYIELHINSPGGSVFDGAAIYNMLVDHPALVDVRVDGLAASIASIIALAGDQITIAKNAMMMIHNPSAMAWGGASDMRKMAGVLDKVKDTLITVYSDRMGLPEDEISKIMDEESWYTAKEAVDAGLADVVGDRAKIKEDGAKARALWTDNPPPWVPDDIIKIFREENKEEQEESEKENESETEKHRAEYIARLEKLAQLEGELM